MRVATRDYARPQRPRNGAARSRPAVRRAGPKSAGSAALGLPLWAWMVVSLSGLFFATSVYYISRPVAPMDMAPSSAEKAGRNGKTIEIPPKEPSRFAFYEMLPSYEVVVPDDVLNPPKPTPGTAANNLPAETVSRPDLPSDLQPEPVATAAAIAPEPVKLPKPAPVKPALAAIAPAAPKPERSPTAAAERELAAAIAREAPQPTAQLARGERFVIQVAAFRTRADAEQRIAALALSGLAARVEQVTIDDKDTWYRVRLGPYGNAAAAASAQQSLKAQGFSGVVMKIKS